MFLKRSSQDHDTRMKDDQDLDLPRSNHRKGSVIINSENPLTRLRKLAGQSQKVYLTIKTMYPFDLYPDTLTIDSNKVNIITKELFGSANVHSILIEDITNLSVNTGLFSASLEIIDSGNLRYPIIYTVKRLRIHEAKLARRLIQGLISAKREGIDLSTCEGKDVLECLNILGHAQGENENRN
jgi:hypothetical protein